MLEIMWYYFVGLIKYVFDYIYFLVFYINSYKWFQKGMFVLIKIVWLIDNRMVGFCLCGEGIKVFWIECCIGGLDFNLYLVLVVQIVVGLKGIEEEFLFDLLIFGDVYEVKCVKEILYILCDVCEIMCKFKFLCEVFFDVVVEYYVCVVEWEIEEFDCVVIDYEVVCGFE